MRPSEAPARRPRCQRPPRRIVHRRPYATPEVYRTAGPRIKAAVPFLAGLALLLALWGGAVALWDTAYDVGLSASEAAHAQR